VKSTLIADNGALPLFPTSVFQKKSEKVKFQMVRIVWALSLCSFLCNTSFASFYFALPLDFHLLLRYFIIKKERFQVFLCKTLPFLAILLYNITVLFIREGGILCGNFG